LGLRLPVVLGNLNQPLRLELVVGCMFIKVVPDVLLSVD